MKTDGAELLRNHGMQVTAQRLAILRAVADAPHCTADDVAEGVRSELGTISRQAVYDALNLLVEKRLLRRIQPAGSAALYEDRVGDNHHHVICRVCGQTEDVDCAAGKAPCLDAVTDSGYRIDEAEVIYWGTCPRCLPKQKRLAKTKASQTASRTSQTASRTTQTASRTTKTASRTTKKSKAGS